MYLTIQKQKKPSKPIVTLEIITKSPNNKYLKSVVYRLTCHGSAKGNIGQTGRNALAQFNERVQALHNNGCTSKFSPHLLENQHYIGTIDNTVGILYIYIYIYTTKIHHLSTLLKNTLFMKKLRKNNNQLDDYITMQPNVVVRATLQHMTASLKLKNKQLFSALCTLQIHNAICVILSSSNT
jgi:hypothetical protein